MPRSEDKLIILIASSPDVELPAVPPPVDASINLNTFFSPAPRNKMISGAMILSLSMLIFLPFLLRPQSLGRELSETEVYCLMAVIAVLTWVSIAGVGIRDNDYTTLHYITHP